MSARDCYKSKLACPCGSTAEVHWSESGYRYSVNVRILKIHGPAIILRPKHSGPLKDDDSSASIICQLCGSLLHEGEKSKVVG
jgi:hypothetical protein